MHPPLAPLNDRTVIAALERPVSRDLVLACVQAPRSAKELSELTMTPLTTIYRQIHRLEALGILIVERSAMTPDGRRYDLYRSRVRSASLTMDERGTTVSWLQNEQVPERLAWEVRAWDIVPSLSE